MESISSVGDVVQAAEQISLDEQKPQEKFLVVKGMESYAGVVHLIELLSLDEQESLLELLQRRLIERRRAVLAREIEEARREFREGKSRVMTPSEIIAEAMA